MSRYLDPTNDVAFKKIFGTEDHKPLLISFLNATLSLSGENAIKSVDFLPKEQVPLIHDNKLTILDIKCITEGNIIFIVEVQNQMLPEFIKRTQYYAAHCYVNQAPSGSEYIDLSPVILLAIVNYTLFPDSESVISYHKTLDTETHEHHHEALSYAYIELPKFKKKESELLTPQDKWIYFFKNWKKTQEIPKAVQEKEIIEAYNVIEEFGWDVGEKDEYLKASLFRASVYRQQQDSFEKGEIKGIQKGIQKGLKEGKLEIAQTILKEKLPIDQISKLTGLSVEEIKSLQN